MLHNTPGTETRINDILRWKCSGEELMPKESLRKKNLPIAVMKVIKKRKSLNNSTCQKQELAPSSEYTIALFS